MKRSHGDDEGERKRSREEVPRREEDEKEGEDRHGEPAPAGAAVDPGNSALREGLQRVRSGQNSQAYIQQLIGNQGANVGARPQLPLNLSAALAAPLNYSNLFLQRAAIPGSLPPGLLQNYGALAMGPNLQQQQLQLAAQNPLLLQLLSQRLLQPGVASINSHIVSNARLAAGMARPDPPSGPNAGTASAAAAAGVQAASLAQPAPQQVQLPTAPVAAVASLPRRSDHPPAARSRSHRNRLLYVPTDDESVNAYQRFARKQIELFEATQDDVDAGAQGRNKPIVLAQVGIRCIHCAELHPRFRARAAVYYPSRLAVMYQAAQNIVNTHLPELCESIPEETRQKLLHLNSKRSAVGGGKTYWAETAAAQGIIDTENGMKFAEGA